MLDFARTNNSFSRFVTSFGEGGDIWHVQSEDIDVDVGDFFETIEAGEEGAPRIVSDLFGFGDKLPHYQNICLLYSPSVTA